MSRAAVTLSIALLVLPALANPPDIEPAEIEPFPAEDHRVYEAAGAGVIKGQAFLRQKGGGVVTCAGSRVLVYPDTPYYRDVFHPSAMALPLPPDHGAHRQVRVGMCDATGNFTVKGIPAGRHNVLAAARWEVAGEGHGGVMQRSVEVPASGEVEVMLTDADFAGR